MKQNKKFIKLITKIAENESVALCTEAFENECASDDLIEAILICPGMYPQEIRTGCTANSFQELLGEKLEYIPHPYDDYAVIVAPSIFSEDLEPNRALRCPDGTIILVFKGSFLVIGGSNEEGYRSLTKKQKRRYMGEYHQPEAFAPYGDYLVVSPLPDDLVKSPED